MPPAPGANFTPHSLNGADYASLALYFALSLAIGWWCRRRSRRSATSFFLGSGRVAWWAAAVSFFATSVSSISFMALPAKSFQEDWLAVGSAPAQSCAGMVTGFVFVGIFRRLNMTTVFDYLERRFDRRTRFFGAGLALVLKVVGRMSIVMLLPALALATVTGLNVYVSILLMGAVTTIYAMEGGFEAVIWTDVMQTCVTVGGVAIALRHIATGVPGGFGGIIDQAGAAGKFHAVSWEFDFTKPTVWVFVGMFFATLFFQISDQPLMQRMLATADERDARRTVTIGNFIGLLSGFVFFFVGTSLWVFYRAHPERLAPTLSGDTIFPFFIVNELPHGIIGFIIAGLFAAAMGALSSMLNSSATIIVSDFYGTLGRDQSATARTRLAWWISLGCGLVATGTALFLAWRNVPSLWDEFLRLAALLGGGFPGVFALGLLTRRANGPGVCLGALAGIVFTWWIQTYTATSVFFHTFLAISCTMLVGYVASLFLAVRVPAKNLRGLTVWDLRAPDAPAALPKDPILCS
jgi:SSS family solute:Na+ symporter